MLSLTDSRSLFLVAEFLDDDDLVKLILVDEFY